MVARRYLRVHANARPPCHDASEKPRHDGEPSQWSMNASKSAVAATFLISGGGLRAPRWSPGPNRWRCENEHIEKPDEEWLKFLILKHPKWSRVGPWRIRLLPRRSWSRREAIVRSRRNERRARPLRR